ncbi:stage III sporulation protein AD [Alkalithermobacter thermoalcaliphilus JW-YL-7 = DSM 7308]|uniref:Stage III sporulation protein AD n=1 Tax=Alkalithermobacter thermoalcaliphilus JW-YL-7 = DSM 7308 TaxID=1121328 RepID=A0A150FPV1_CLOPD|nr:stage III sporulation protein AD [[Clostridium] paradoxum JW-YL-7 = DSM 7308]SHK95034.1 stage III sporulation protein AD [[Clostridium] paradoxum JW-YL-7 = DSM 7308]
MDLSKLIGTALLGITLSLLFKKDKPEISMFIGLITGVGIFLASLHKLSFIIDSVVSLSNKININTLYLSTIIKVVGISYLIEFAIQICKDAGEGAIASKLEFAGKVMILTMSFPIMLSILETIINIIP